MIKILNIIIIGNEIKAMKVIIRNIVSFVIDNSPIVAQEGSDLMHYGSSLVTPGSGEGKEPEVDKDTVSRPEGRLRCLIGFREVSEQSWRKCQGLVSQGYFWKQLIVEHLIWVIQGLRIQKVTII